ncbi:hypothetical protein K435DRAFT_755610 [Dendrothele bispora CBS 962.96]|uniref:Carbohydrate esterase family 16 protein n=1 Tax=Dendrothele bispora (strain CBS 962.96) TaxID=1314807 RepID=A0A4S8M142_DENBC|nr:hypothetical protein K435DRAFT_755610 [Dendrothele bispora CBS 962.96]
MFPTIFCVASAVISLHASVGYGAALPHRACDTETAKRFSAIVAFGDSFTDNGNGAWVLSNHTWPANPNYFQGKFSNGLVWIEYVAQNLSVPLFDNAIGGATTSNDLVQGFTGPNSVIPVPSIDLQVAEFLNSPPSSFSSEKPLFALLGGANDVIFNPNITASQSFQTLMASKSKLETAYPNAQFLFLDYPDLSRIPYDFYLSELGQRELDTFSKELRQLYEDMMVDNIRNSNANSQFVDLMGLFEEWDYYRKPEAFGFEPLGSYGSCLVGVYGETENVTLCENPDEMVFWDEYHPTTHAHSWIAKRVLSALVH